MLNFKNKKHERELIMYNNEHNKRFRTQASHTRGGGHPASTALRGPEGAAARTTLLRFWAAQRNIQTKSLQVSMVNYLTKIFVTELKSKWRELYRSDFNLLPTVL